MAKLSAFADEVTSDFHKQVNYLTKEGVFYIELRFINKKNIMDLNQDELNLAKRVIQDYGLKVSAVGSLVVKERLDKNLR